MKLTELVTALEDYKQLVQNVIDPLNALLSANVSAGTPHPALPPPAVTQLPAPQLSEKIGRLKRAIKVAKAKSGQKVCSEHPGFERDKQDRCKQCVRDYAREWARKKKAGKTGATIAERRPAEMRSVPTSKPNEIAGHRPRLQPEAGAPSPVKRRTPDAFTGDELEYSKPITCPKCHSLNVRMSRPEDFNRDTDSWTCLKNGCQVRIAHVVLSVDRGWEPDAA